MTAQPRLSRRTALRLFGGGGAGLAMLAACAPIGSSTAPTPPAGQGASSAFGTAPPAGVDQPKRGGTLRLTMAEPSPLDGHVISPNVFDSVWMIYDTLTAYDENLQPQPMLAESWEVSSDSKQIKLTLRKGVQLHNGRELTSDDVVWNLQRVRDPKTGVAQLANQSNWFTSVEAPDKYTVVLRSEQSRPAMFDFFEYFNIVGKDAIDSTDPKARLVGTGPFAFVEYQQGDHLALKKNPNYWQSGKPYLDEVRINFSSDPQANIVQLEAGAIDLLGNPPLRDAARLKQDSRFKVLVSQTSGTYYLLAMNCVLAPTDNKVVRQALNYAVDRQRFVDSVLFKAFGEPRDLPWPPRSPAAEPAKNNVYTFDLDKAKALLAQAGASNLDLEFVYVTADPVAPDFGQIYQADLAKIGVKLKVDEVENAKFYEINGDKALQGNDLQAWLNARTTRDPAIFWSTQRNYRGGPTTGTHAYENPELESIIAQAASEPDADKRKRMYQQTNEMVLNSCHVIQIATNPRVFAYGKVVDGVRVDLNGNLVMDQATVNR